jgi:hypothetical protein
MRPSIKFNGVEKLDEVEPRSMLLSGNHLQEPGSVTRDTRQNLH